MGSFGDNENVHFHKAIFVSTFPNAPYLMDSFGQQNLVCYLQIKLNFR